MLTHRDGLTLHSSFPSIPLSSSPLLLSFQSLFLHSNFTSLFLVSLFHLIQHTFPPVPPSLIILSFIHPVEGPEQKPVHVAAHVCRRLTKCCGGCFVGYPVKRCDCSFCSSITIARRLSENNVYLIINS